MPKRKKRKPVNQVFRLRLIVKGRDGIKKELGNDYRLYDNISPSTRNMINIAGAILRRCTERILKEQGLKLLYGEFKIVEKK